MREVFADTCFLIALINPHDSLHEAAVEAARDCAGARIVITDEVLVELLNFFSSYGAPFRRAAVQIIESLAQREDVTIIPQSRESFAQGFVLYRARPDKGYSGTDCVSMAAMKGNNITEALTNDPHFRQEGFVPLLARKGGDAY